MALRKDEHVLVSHRHRYKGLTVPDLILDASIDAMQTFDCRDDDVWIVTFPRSGTHWMMEIVGLIYANGNPDSIDRSLSSSTVCMVNMEHDVPVGTLGDPPAVTPFLDRVLTAKSPRIIPSHLPGYLLPPDLVQRSKVIYVARNPKDVVRSYFDLLSRQQRLSWEEFLERFMEGSDFPFGPWLDHVVCFWKLRKNENVLFLFYEEMLADLGKSIQRVAEFIGRPLSDEILQQVFEHSTFEGMKNTHSDGAKNTFYMGKDKREQWKERFTVAQSESFDQWLREKMAEEELEFPF